MIRKQLVLTEMGIALPMKADGETLDARKLLAIEISRKKDDEFDPGTVYSPLRSEKPTASVVAMIKPIFPLTTNINYREDLTIEDESVFKRACEKLLS